MKFTIKKNFKKCADQVNDGCGKIKNSAKEAAVSIDKNHETISDHADTAAKATRVAAGIAVVSATVAAPTGITAIGVAVGVVSAPAIVTAAPILVGIAGAAFTISAGASLYTKMRNKKKSNESNNQDA